MMKETDGGPYGLKEITLESGTRLYKNSNGIFDKYGVKMTDISVNVYIYDGWMETINLAESLGWDSTEAWKEDRDPDEAETSAMVHIKEAGMHIVFP